MNKFRPSLSTTVRSLLAAVGRLGIFTLVGTIALRSLSAQGASPDPAQLDREFTLKVYPLLKEKCFACHGDDSKKVKGDLNMLSRDGMLKGGEYSDKVLVPGDAAASDLYVAVTWQNEDLEMPPKENDRLNEEQIAILRDWIDSGAQWPDTEAQEKFKKEEWSVIENENGVITTTSGGLADSWTYRRYRPEDIWAFKPVIKPEISESGENPIDAMIDAKRAEAGFESAPLADPRTLIRRIYLDLIGMQPTAQEMSRWASRFEEVPTDGAASIKLAHKAVVADLVGELLASPHYGERWAQHWLDVARYADTGGMSNDYERSNAWRYRDYVIRSFNEDKPYNRFIVEQIAGDELADVSVRERVNGDEEKVRETRLSGDYTEREAEWIVATGFLRMGPWDNAMVKEAEARQMYLDDVINSVGQTFLATTMRCFKCHDHKFDPLPTKDYYRMYSAFAGTQMAERPVPLLPSERTDGFEEGKTHVKQMLAFATEETNKIKVIQEAAERAWYAERNLEFVAENERKEVDDENKPPRAAGLDHVQQGQLKVREQDVWIWTRRLERYQAMAQSVYNGSDGKLAWNGARKLRIAREGDPNWRPKSTIYTGGALEAPGESVKPGVLSAIRVPVEGAPQDDPYITTEDLDGRRLGVAKWIADPNNPLTTRAIVNRIWQHHFGKPIAGNPNNFGVKGAKPTHPELLDWLAADFVEHGWTIKRMHKLIMTSRTYRQSVAHPQMEKLREKDPDNALLAFFPPRRLTAEEIRDSLLRMTGELNPVQGGLPVMPEMNMEVALAPRMIQFSLAPAYQASPTPQERNRRTIYAYRVRGLADPFLEIFNQPNPNDSCEARDAAAVSPQAFTLLNSDLITDRSIAFATRLEKNYQSLNRQIEEAFELALGRGPDATELERLAEYVTEMRDYHASTIVAPTEYPTKITRSLVEEFSGRPFEYVEILPAYQHYQSDLKANDVGPETRALADMCLLLFNSNEFAYVY